MAGDRTGACGPLVSVVLPTRDRPHRLRTSLASALAQTHRNLEIIVVDDASLRPVEDVVAAVGGDDPRVRLVRRDTRGGAAAARNTALALASGEFVAFIDDDDRWTPGKVSRQVAFLEDHPTVGIVTSDHVVMSDGRRGGVHFRGPAAFGAQHMLWVNFAGSFSFVMARRSVLGSELWIDESFPSVEDWDLWLRCSRVADTGVVREPLVHYVRHGEAQMSDTSSHRPGIEWFAKKHGAAMSDACRGFHRAHQHMEAGEGLAKRARVAGAIAGAGSPEAAALLLLEQGARQLGRFTRDPGMHYRSLALAISSLRGRRH